MFHEDAQPFLGLFGDCALTGDKKIRIGLVFPSAHPPPELIHLGQSEFVGAVDHNGVCRRDIKA